MRDFTDEDDQRPLAPADRRAAVATIIPLLWTAVTNAFLLMLGWDDVFVAFILGPVANFLLIVLAVILEPWITNDGISRGHYMLMAVAAPIIACAILFVLIISGILLR